MRFNSERKVRMGKGFNLHKIAWGGITHDVEVYDDGTIRFNYSPILDDAYKKAETFADWLNDEGTIAFPTKLMEEIVSDFKRRFMDEIKYAEKLLKDMKEVEKRVKEIK